jgi:hypothetical protein
MSCCMEGRGIMGLFVLEQAYQRQDDPSRAHCIVGFVIMLYNIFQGGCFHNYGKGTGNLIGR